MYSCEGSTNLGYLVTNSDGIGSMECEVGMTPGGLLCLCRLPGIVGVNKNQCDG